MRLLLLLSLFSVPVIAADEFLEFGDKNFAAEKTGESKWTLRSGFQYIDYPMSLPAFKGEHDETTAKDTTGIYGLNIAVGREFYLGAGISSTFLISGNYYKSINKEVGIAAQDVDVDVSSQTYLIGRGLTDKTDLFFIFPTVNIKTSFSSRIEIKDIR